MLMLGLSIREQFLQSSLIITHSKSLLLITAYEIIGSEKKQKIRFPLNHFLSLQAPYQG